MSDQELRTLLAKELGIEHLAEAAQDEIIAKIGDVVLKSLTVSILETLPPDAQAEFEAIGAQGNPALIQEFLAKHAPNIELLLAEEMQKTIAGFKTNKG